MSMFRISRLTAVAASIVAALAAISLVSAQTYGGNLPPGVVNASVGGAALNLVTTPTIQTNQPTISGKLATGGGTVSISIQSATVQFTAPVARDGSFSAQVPTALAAGQHALFFNSNLVGHFVVASGLTAPNTGTGMAADGGAGGTVAIALVLAVIGISLAGIVWLLQRRAA